MRTRLISHIVTATTTIVIIAHNTYSSVTEAKFDTHKSWESNKSILPNNWAFMVKNVKCFLENGLCWFAY